MRPTKPPKIPYPFVVDLLTPLAPEVRRIFSAFGVYIGDKLVLMLRERPKHPDDNGVWVVFSEKTNPDDPSTRRDLPLLRPIALLGNKMGHWRVLPASAPHFETEATRVCDFLLKKDPRFGRVPDSRK